MKKINVENAVGFPLCHDITAIRDGFKGVAFRRGHVITEDDIPKLLDLGKRCIFVWEESAGEIHEEDAALRLAAMAQVIGAHYTAPSEGKVSLISDTRGLFRVDTDLLDKINSIGDITICSIPDHFPIEPGYRIASARIVPLVTKEDQIISAENFCAGKKLFDIRPYKRLHTGIVITGSEIYSGRIVDKFEPIARKKLSKFPCDILGFSICDDAPAMLSAAIDKYLEAGADLIILTGGMSVDPDDLTFSAIEATGAEIITKGVPAQPGNMFTLAYLGDVAIIGVPGAAVHAKITMFDVVLPQLFTGDRFAKKDLVHLGEGGLCLQCPDCYFPACTFGRY